MKCALYCKPSTLVDCTEERFESLLRANTNSFIKASDYLWFIDINDLPPADVLISNYEHFFCQLFDDYKLTTPDSAVMVIPLDLDKVNFMCELPSDSANYLDFFR